jgi:hypothetical protein
MVVTGQNIGMGAQKLYFEQTQEKKFVHQLQMQPLELQVGVARFHQLLA